MARARNGTSEYVKLEQRLVLLAWLNGQFGVIGAGLRAFMARKFLDWYLHRRGEMLRSLKGVRSDQTNLLK